MFDTVKLDLETQRQMTVMAIQDKIDEGNMTDVEEDFWDDVITEVEKLTKDDITPEKYVRQAQRKLRKIRRAEARIKERLSPKL